MEMKIWRKCSAAIMAFCLMLSGLHALARTEDYTETDSGTKAADYLMMLRIADERAVFTGETPLTKGEAAALLVKSLGETDTARLMAVPEGLAGRSHADMAAYAVSRGILAGDGLAQSWDETITAIQAAKMMVAALGYGTLAEYRGGYPAGYLYYAQQFRPSRDVTMSQNAPITRIEFAKMLCRAFDAELLSAAGVGSGLTYESRAGDTMEKQYLERKGWTVGEGIVEGTEVSRAAGMQTLLKDEVLIGGVKLSGADAALKERLGYRVQYVSVDPEAGKQTLLGWRILDKNIVEFLSWENEAYCSGRTVTYYDLETKRYEKLMLDENAAVWYNRKPLVSYQESELDLSHAELIDNDNDDLYEVVKLTHSESFTVSKVNVSSEVIFLESGSFRGQNALYMTEESGRVVSVHDLKGNEIDWKTLKAKDAISVIASKDMDYLEIVLLEEPVKGRVSEIVEGESITIDGIRYNRSEQLSDVSVGDAGYFYRNEFGEIFYFENDRTEYVYLIKKGRSGSQLSTQKEIQVFDRQTGVKEYLLTESLGKDYEAIPERAVVTLQRNSDGLVTKITPAEAYGEAGERMYCEYVSGFNDDKNKRLQPFRFDESTAFFMVPNNGNKDEFGIDLELEDNDLYWTQAFDYDSDSGIVKAAVLIVDTEKDAASTLNYRSKVGIVSKIFQVSDGNDGTSYVLEGYSEGEKIRICAAQNSEVHQVFRSLRAGDVIRYNKNMFGEIVKAECLVSLAETREPFHIGRDSVDERFFGTVMTLQKNVLTNYSKYLYHEMNVSELASYSGMTLMRMFAHTENAKDKKSVFADYYIYDRSQKEVRQASVDDIVSYENYSIEPSMVYVQRSKSDVQFIVIVKD